MGGSGHLFKRLSFTFGESHARVFEFINSPSPAFAIFDAHLCELFSPRLLGLLATSNGSSSVRVAPLLTEIRYRPVLLACLAGLALGLVLPFRLAPASDPRIPLVQVVEYLLTHFASLVGFHSLVLIS